MHYGSGLNVYKGKSGKLVVTQTPGQASPKGYALARDR